MKSFFEEDIEVKEIIEQVDSVQETEKGIIPSKLPLSRTIND